VFRHILESAFLKIENENASAAVTVAGRESKIVVARQCARENSLP
jgi:hypothetical protein